MTIQRSSAEFAHMRAVVNAALDPRPLARLNPPVTIRRIGTDPVIRSEHPDSRPLKGKHESPKCSHGARLED